MLDPRSLVDVALEISIVGSFSSIGYRIRRRLFGWRDPVPGSLEGRTALVTGPTSGLGGAAARELARLGARVILVGRSEARLQAVADRSESDFGGGRYAIVVADMSSLADVRGAVTKVLDSEARLDVIVDSAGTIHQGRTVTAEGLEATFATMVVGPFVLIEGLLPLLEQDGGGQVVTVVSGGMYGQSLDLDDLQFARATFDGTRAYARAKRAATALTRERARRFADRAVRFDAMHPGWADTPGLADSLPGFYRLMRPLLRTPLQGVDTITWLATSDAADEPDGRLYLDRRPRPFDRVPATRLGPSQRARLWDEVARLARSPDSPS